MKQNLNILLFLILLLASVLRIYKVSEYPQGLYWDEVAIGYNAYSVLQTGKDEYGKLLPITFESFQDSKLPGYIYLTSISELFFGVTSFAVRFISVVSGVVSVYLVYLISKKLFKNKQLFFIPFVSAFLMAISPWALQFSRVGFEANTALTVSLFAIYFYLQFLKNNRSYYLAILFVCLSCYFYYQEWIFFPFFILITSIFLYKSICVSLKKIVLGGLLVLILLSPLLYTFFLSGSETRLSHVENIITDPDVIKESVAIRAEEKNYLVGTLLYNRRVVRLNAFLKAYITHFSPDYLFFTGDPNLRHSILDIGMMYMWLMPFFVLGFSFIVAREKFARIIIIPWLLLSPISASISYPVPHGLRSLLMLPVVEMISAVGILWVLTILKRNLHRKVYLVSVFIVVIICSYYLMNYFYNYYQLSSKNSSYWAYGHRDIFEFTQSVKDQYSNIYVTGKYWRPYIFMLFYTRYSPKEYHNNPNHTMIDKYYFGYASHDTSDPRYIYDEDLVNKLREGSNNLLVLAPDEVKDGDRVIKTIDFLNGIPAFVIIESRPEI